MNKTITIGTLIAIAVCLAAVIVSDDSSAETYSGTCGTNLTWTFDSDVATLTVSGNGTHMDDWNSAADVPWATHSLSIESVVVTAASLTNIGNNAFNDCTSLANVTLSTSVTTIGMSAFSGCSDLQTINIDHVHAIGSNAFEMCTSLDITAIPPSVRDIGDVAFADSSVRISIIPSTVDYIGALAFMNVQIENIIIQGNTEFGSEVFDGTGLKGVTILANPQFATSTFTGSSVTEILNLGGLDDFSNYDVLATADVHSTLSADMMVQQINGTITTYHEKTDTASKLLRIVPILLLLAVLSLLVVQLYRKYGIN